MPVDIERVPVTRKKVGEKGDVEVYIPFEGFFISGEYTVISEEINPGLEHTPKYTNDPLDSADVSIFE